MERGRRVLAEKPLLEIILTSWNELVYLKSLIPQFLKVADKIHIVDDFSTDGTAEYIASLNNKCIDFFQRKFDQCSNQFDAALQRCTKDNTWVWCATPDEVPTTFWFENIHKVLTSSDSVNIDRIWTLMFHMRGLDSTSAEIGQEVRLFRNDEHHKCQYVGFPHELLHGKFDGNFTDLTPDEKFAVCHFKQFDKNKLNLWKTDYVEKLIYSAKDINRRLKYNTIALPTGIEYTISNELRNYLCSQ